LATLLVFTVGVRVDLFNPDLATDHILKRIPRLFLIE